jgi:hypothetical protein
MTPDLKTFLEKKLRTITVDNHDEFAEVSNEFKHRGIRMTELERRQHPNMWTITASHPKEETGKLL